MNKFYLITLLVGLTTASFLKAKPFDLEKATFAEDRARVTLMGKLQNLPEIFGSPDMAKNIKDQKRIIGRYMFLEDKNSAEAKELLKEYKEAYDTYRFAVNTYYHKFPDTKKENMFPE